MLASVFKSDINLLFAVRWFILIMGPGFSSKSPLSISSKWKKAINGRAYQRIRFKPFRISYISSSNRGLSYVICYVTNQHSSAMCCIRARIRLYLVPRTCMHKARPRSMVGAHEHDGIRNVSICVRRMWPRQC